MAKTCAAFRASSFADCSAASALARSSVKDITAVSNNAGVDNIGLGLMLHARGWRAHTKRHARSINAATKSLSLTKPHPAKKKRQPKACKEKKGNNSKNWTTCYRSNISCSVKRPLHLFDKGITCGVIAVPAQRCPLMVSLPNPAGSMKSKLVRVSCDTSCLGCGVFYVAQGVIGLIVHSTGSRFIRLYTGVR